MRKLTLLLFPLLLAACASSSDNSDPSVPKVEPDAKPSIRIVQTSRTPLAAEHAEGGVPIHYAMRVDNNGKEAITLTNITMQTLGDGGYTLYPSSHPFKTVIEPGANQTVEFWMPAYVEITTVQGSNSPVTVRAQVRFRNSKGQFEEVLVDQVGANLGR